MSLTRLSREGGSPEKPAALDARLRGHDGDWEE
jgi:hypothetical protein